MNHANGALRNQSRHPAPAVDNNAVLRLNKWTTVAGLLTHDKCSTSSDQQSKDSHGSTSMRTVMSLHSSLISIVRATLQTVSSAASAAATVVINAKLATIQLLFSKLQVDNAHILTKFVLLNIAALAFILTYFSNVLFHMMLLP